MSTHAVAEPGDTAVLEVIAPGAQALLQDLGRTGVTDGLPTGGAADRHSLRLANRLVGNRDDAVGLELLLGGLTLRARTTLTIAVAGAPCEVRVDGRAAAFGSPLHLSPGAEITLGTARFGLRTYVAVRGGLEAPLVLGSHGSSPTLGLGHPPLRAGDRLHAHTSSIPTPQPADLPPIATWGHPVRARLVLGPRDDWFTPEALDRLASTTWQVGSEVDRIGVRLTGPTLRRSAARHTAELPSEPMVRGAIQVPPDGQPVVLLADHPVTGGYPVVGVVVDADTDRIAQLRPGDALTFTPVPRPWR